MEPGLFVYPHWGGIAIVAQSRAEYTHSLQRDTPSASEPLAAAWELTRRLAPRRYVRTMIADVDGHFSRNSYPRMFPVVGHMPPDSPWVIELTDEAERLFRYAVFDLDAKTPDAFSQAAEDLATLVRVLRGCGLPHVVCRSSPAGGFHVWLPLAGIHVDVMVELANAAKAVFPSLDHGLLRNADAGAVRPPLSPHAKGGFSSVMEGADPVEVLLTESVDEERVRALIDALRELRPEVEPDFEIPSGEIDASHRAHRQLDAWGQALMATVDGGADPSHTGYLCVLAAVRAGWTLADVEHAARTAPGMEHYRTQPDPRGRGSARVPRRPAEAQSRLARQYAKAEYWVRLHPYTPRDRDTKDLTELAGIVGGVSRMLQDLRVSSGRWARSEQAFHDASVLVAVAWLSLRSGRRDVGASIRSLAEITGVPSSSVDRALNRLRRDGWLTRVKESEGVEAAVYRLSGKFSTAPVHDGPHHITNARPPGALFDERIVLLREVEDRIRSGAHDVFTRQGLGQTARRVFEALTGYETPDRDVADRAGLPLARARVALARLRSHALVVADGLRWRRRKEDWRSAVARRLGIEGILRRRAQQYAWEREQWAWWNAELVFRAGRTPRQRRRPDPKQGVIFKLRDLRGDDHSWPAYPRTVDDRPDHLTAIRLVKSGAVQTLRDVELAA